MSTLAGLTGSSPSIATELLILAVGALVVWGLKTERRRQRRRTADVSRLAASLGLEFEAERPRDFPGLERLLPYGCKLADVRNIFRGWRGGLEAVSFDCIVRCRNTRIIGDPKTTVACFRMRGKNLPWFSLEPDTSHNMLPARAAIPGGGVRLDAIPEFSRDFLARTRDRNPEAVRKLFTPEVQSFMAGFDARREWFVWGDGEWVCPRIPGAMGVLPPEEYSGFLQRAIAVADVFFRASG